MISGSFL